MRVVIAVVLLLLFTNCVQVEAAPIHDAAIKGCVKLVRQLLDAGANVNARGGEMPLTLAARGGHKEVVELLIERGAYVNSIGGGFSPPIIEAIRPGNEKIVHLLLQHGAYVNSLDEGGWTPLHLAARGNYPEIARILLEYKADVCSKTYYVEGTPYDVAAPQIRQMLIHHGANTCASKE